MCHIYSFYYAFTDNAFNKNWVGLQNFKILINSEFFQLALKNTFLFSVISIPLIMILSITISSITAYFLHNVPLLKNAFFLPVLLPSVTIVLIVSIPAAYIFAKVPFRTRDWLFYIYIIVMMMPFQVTLLPQYIVSRHLGTYDTLLAMILPGIFAPFSVFLLTQITKSIPNDILEASKIETSNSLIILLKIIAPIIRPGIVCTAVLTYTEQWNMVAETLVLLDTSDKYPLAALLSSPNISSPHYFASTLIFILPPMFLFSFFENEIIEGIGEYRLK